MKMDLADVEKIILIAIGVVAILQLLVLLRIESFRYKMNEIQKNQDLVAKHINDVRNGGIVRLADKDIA